MQRTVHTFRYEKLVPLLQDISLYRHYHFSLYGRDLRSNLIDIFAMENTFLFIFMDHRLVLICYIVFLIIVFGFILHLVYL